MKLFKKNESGRSMVEMLGVLAVVGVLSIGGIAGYKMAMEQIETNNIYNFFRELELAIRHLNQTAVHEDEFLYSDVEMEVDAATAMQHNKDLLCASSLISKGCGDVSQGKRYFVLDKLKYSILFHENANQLDFMIQFPDTNKCKMLFRAMTMYGYENMRITIESYGGPYYFKDFSEGMKTCEKINGTTNMYFKFFDYL